MKLNQQKGHLIVKSLIVPRFLQGLASDSVIKLNSVGMLSNISFKNRKNFEQFQRKNKIIT